MFKLQRLKATSLHLVICLFTCFLFVAILCILLFMLFKKKDIFVNNNQKAIIKTIIIVVVVSCRSNGESSSRCSRCSIHFKDLCLNS